MSLNENMGPADIAALSGGNGGMWDNGAWWIIILFLFAFTGGLGGNGFGNRSQGAADNYVLASDFATVQRQMSDGFGALERKGDGIANGLCDGFYAQNTTMLNGFAGIQNGMSTQGYETRNAITQAQIAQMQSANALQAQIANCCCDNRAATADLKYTVGSVGSGVQAQISNGFCDTSRQVERGFADTGYALATNANTIVQSSHADTDRVIAKLEAMEAARQQERISELQNENQGLRLAASQQAQNAYLVGQLRPAPVPAFTVPNPYAYNGCNCA